MNLKTDKAITLVALIITIIILLILAGVTLSMVLGDNGLINKAQSSVDKYQESANKEQRFLNELEKYIYSKGPITMVDIDTVFDQTGDIDGKLHVGDFVNYSAGTWDGDNGEEFKKIANTGVLPGNSVDITWGACSFGGFTSTSSRDENATSFDSKYSYITDKETGEAVIGWRIFDIEDDKITLISAGCPEDFYNQYASGRDYSYISEYILTGNINSGANASGLGLGSQYYPRDWDMYLAPKYKEMGEATVLTKGKLDSWFNKYMGITNADTEDQDTFQKIYNTKYESLIYNGVRCWFPPASSNLGLHALLSEKCVTSADSGMLGIRVLITLPATVKVSEESIGTKTVTSRGIDYIYNIWNID